MPKPPEPEQTTKSDTQEKNNYSRVDLTTENYPIRPIINTTNGKKNASQLESEHKQVKSPTLG